MKVIKWFIALFVLFSLMCSDKPLQVNIEHPVDGAAVAGIQRITVNASDNVVHVSFFIDDSCVYIADDEPFTCLWNTYESVEGSSHMIYAIAEDRKGNQVYSESITVTVENGEILFSDDFEEYLPLSYPEVAWFAVWSGAGNNHTFVVPGMGYGGTNGFRLTGLDSWVRTDGVELALDSIQRLIYEVSLMIPSGEPTGALFGFFVMLNPQLGTIYNGIWFSHTDSTVYARGVIEDSTGYIWRHDTWYRARVMLDYGELKMNVWLNEQQIVFDLPAVHCALTDTFVLATEHGKAGLVYYDDISIRRSSRMSGSCPATAVRDLDN